MLCHLIKLASDLDASGHITTANQIDHLIKLAALNDVVLNELKKHIHTSVGLADVPAAVKSLAEKVGGINVRDLWNTLYDLHKNNYIELRPESGLNRRSTMEMFYSPPGPQGTRLTWARLLTRD